MAAAPLLAVFLISLNMGRHDAVNALYDRVAASKQSVAGLTVSISVPESGRLSRLMAGDMSLYREDRSTADFALCCLLAKNHNCNAFRIEAEFRKSGLYREKWERDDYRECTITRAIKAVAREMPTRNRWRAAFSLIFRAGTDNEKITTNPAARVKRKTEDNGRFRFLTEKEEKTLTVAITDPNQLASLDISLHTGKRMSEQVGLKWSQVDVDKRMVTLTRTKNGRAHYIPLKAAALAAFRSLPAEHGKQTKDSPVFPNGSGEAVHTTRGWFEDAVARAGLTHNTWHCNRHTLASRLVMAGVDLRTVAELMNHKTIAMTMRYAHLAPEHKASAMDRFVQLVPKPVQEKSRKRK